MSDLNPPAWRGQPGSTFQHWEFSRPGPIGDPGVAPWDPDLTLPPSTGKLSPEMVNNPCGRPELVVQDVDSPATEWKPQYAGRRGVWRLEPRDIGQGDSKAHLNSAIMVWIPNCKKVKLVKSIRLQITYKRETDDPDVNISWPTEATPVGVNVLELSDQWTHKTWDFVMTCDVNGEQIDIQPSDVVYVDQVVVDTICARQKRGGVKPYRGSAGRPRRRPPVRITTEKQTIQKSIKIGAGL